MDSQQIFNKFESDKYIKNVVEKAIFYGKMPYEDGPILFFNYLNIPKYGDMDDLTEATLEASDDECIDIDKLNDYLREKRFNGNEFDEYLKIKSKQAEYEFNEKMYDFDLKIIDAKDINKFESDLNYLYNNYYDAYSDVLWGILEMNYFNGSYESLVEAFKYSKYDNCNIMLLISYISKYYKDNERKL